VTRAHVTDPDLIFQYICCCCKDLGFISVPCVLVQAVLQWRSIFESYKALTSTVKICRQNTQRWSYRRRGYGTNANFIASRYLDPPQAASPKGSFFHSKCDRILLTDRLDGCSFLTAPHVSIYPHFTDFNSGGMTSILRMPC
jgi:hypothetical protein